MSLNEIMLLVIKKLRLIIFSVFFFGLFSQVIGNYFIKPTGIMEFFVISNVDPEDLEAELSVKLLSSDLWEGFRREGFPDDWNSPFDFLSNATIEETKLNGVLSIKLETQYLESLYNLELLEVIVDDLVKTINTRSSLSGLNSNLGLGELWQAYLEEQGIVNSAATDDKLADLALKSFVSLTSTISVVKIVNQDITVEVDRGISQAWLAILFSLTGAVACIFVIVIRELTSRQNLGQP